ncbi:Hsp20/alpha crystallin family protein [soil metagenome]
MALVRRNRSVPSPMQGWDLGNFGDLFGDVERLMSQAASPMLGQVGASTSYPVDIYETEGDLVLEMAVPGVRIDDLDISIEGCQLSIRGNLPDHGDSSGEGQNGGQRRYWLQSIPRGQFSHGVTLPSAVEADKIEARVNDGLLVLTIPKVAEARARKISISHG